jgi:hypothetical protein
VIELYTIFALLSTPFFNFFVLIAVTPLFRLSYWMIFVDASVNRAEPRAISASARLRRLIPFARHGKYPSQ